MPTPAFVPPAKHSINLIGGGEESRSIRLSFAVTTQHTKLSANAVCNYIQYISLFEFVFHFALYFTSAFLSFFLVVTYTLFVLLIRWTYSCWAGRNVVNLFTTVNSASLSLFPFCLLLHIIHTRTHLSTCNAYTNTYTH